MPTSLEAAAKWAVTRMSDLPWAQENWGIQLGTKH